MGNAPAEFETLDFDDFEELLADKPRNERWELIGGRVVRMMVGAALGAWAHRPERGEPPASGLPREGLVLPDVR